MDPMRRGSAIVAVVAALAVGGTACRSTAEPTPVPMHVGEAYDNPGTALVPAMKIEDFRMTSISPAV